MKREIPGATYSLADDLRLKRLPNWGRWGRQDSCRPDPNAGESSIYGLGGRIDPGDEGWGEDGSVGDAIVPIDWRDAELIDGWIRQLPPRHRTVIRATFYRRAWPSPTRLDVDAAIRAIVDLMAENKRVVQRMRGGGG